MSGSWLSDLTAWLAVNPGWLAAALFATAFVESLAIAGVIVPGVAVLFAVAVLAGKTGMPLTEALVWAGLGAVAGDSISFALGRCFNGRLTSIWPFSRYPTLIAKGEAFFHRHGGKSVVAGRFIGPIRPVLPLIAGALRMSWRRFLGFNMLSALGWAPVYILPGFLVGAALDSDFQLPAHFYAVVGTGVAIVFAVYFVLLRLQLGLGEGRPLYRWVEQRIRRYDTAHRFWRLYTNERPAREGEFPLASVLLTLAATGAFLLWATITTSGTLDGFNQQVLAWTSALRQPLLDGPALAFTLLGDPTVLIGAAILAALALAVRGYYAATLHIALAALLTNLLIWGLKAAFDIVRPDQVAAPPTSGAFPSGHATGITVLVTLLASFVAAESRHRQRWQIYLAFSLVLVPVALSRLYLGVHWFTDIVGGILLGLAITGLIRASYSRYDRVPISLDSVTVTAGIAWVMLTIGYMTCHWHEAVHNYQPKPGSVSDLPALPAAAATDPAVPVDPAAPPAAVSRRPPTATAPSTAS